MRLVMIGTGPFAVPTFRGLFDTHHALTALVTKTSQPHGRRRKPAMNPMRDVAHEHGTRILDPEDINSPEFCMELAALEADLLVVCDYGQILSSATLATSLLGGINLHGSLLPKYRGAAPINWAIYNGEEKTGCSVIHMTPRVDAGPVIAQGTAPIDPDETAEELERRLAEVGFWLVRRAIDSLESGELQAVPQNAALASSAPRLKKTDGLIDWSRTAEQIRNQVRAMEPWPKTYSFLHRSGGPTVRLILGPVSVMDASEPNTRPGTILEVTEDKIVVAAGRRQVVLTTLQPAGKRLMTVPEFIRGNDVRPGDRFGPQ
jgi:methionyl-tRNA formyltransferase